MLAEPRLAPAASPCGSAASRSIQLCTAHGESWWWRGEDHGIWGHHGATAGAGRGAQRSTTLYLAPTGVACRRAPQGSRSHGRQDDYGVEIVNTGQQERTRSIALGGIAIVLLTFVLLGPMVWLLAWVESLLPFVDGKAPDTADLRSSVLAPLAALAGLGALYYTARTYGLSRRGQLADRYAKACELLDSESLEKRLGGLYSVEQIMHDSSHDHGKCITLLSSFVRTRRLVVGWFDRPDWIEMHAESREHQELPVDIAAAMTILAGRPERPEPGRCDLRGVDLRSLSLRKYDFPDAPSLRSMFLTRADLSSADLRGADLSKTIATGIRLSNAWLSDSDLTATLLTRADLRGANLYGARLFQTRLDGANLDGVEGLEPEQLASARIDDKSVLPPTLRNDPWVQARLADCRQVPDPEPPHWCPPPTLRPHTDSPRP